MLCYKQNAFILRAIFVLHLSGPIKQIYIHNKMSYVFNVGLITPWDTRLPNGFPSLIFMNVQVRSYSYWTTG